MTQPSEHDHTPTPWIADDGDGQYFIIANGETGDAVAVLVDPISVGGHDILLPRDENFVKAAKGEGQFELVYTRYAEHKANAAFIVEAVNNHALLKSHVASGEARIARLEEALRIARASLITFGGDPRRSVADDGDASGDEMQAALLDRIDASLTSGAA